MPRIDVARIANLAKNRDERSQRGGPSSRNRPLLGIDIASNRNLFSNAIPLPLHRASRAFLERSLAEPFGGPTVVVTHHAPTPLSVPDRFSKDTVSSAFASDLTGLVERSGAALWLHGHLHDNFDYRVGRTRVVCNPHGYERENPDFDEAMVLEVDAE